ncbi:hypothetical protein CGRA01v4_03511 [Colletotrichum graminicola]|nr:hypothetical protein CGRA01v4_03511 [Colletotrichum graminicola]
MPLGSAIAQYMWNFFAQLDQITLFGRSF